MKCRQAFLILVRSNRYMYMVSAPGFAYNQWLIEWGGAFEADK